MTGNDVILTVDLVVLITVLSRVAVGLAGARPADALVKVLASVVVGIVLVFGLNYLWAGRIMVAPPFTLKPILLAAGYSVFVMATVWVARKRNGQRTGNG